MADTPTPYLHEFLWRGRAPDDATPPAFHVILAVDGTDGFGQPTHSEMTMNMAQAADAGIDLGSIVEGINASSLAQIETLMAQLAAATIDRDSARQERDTLTVQVTDLQAQLAAVVSA